MAVLSVFIIFFGVKMWQSGFSKHRNFSIKLSERLSVYLKTQIGMIISGFVIGLTTGVLGAGGGLTIFVILYSFFNFPLKKAIGTSSFIMLLTALSGVIGYWENGNLDITLGLTIGICAALGGTFSSVLANRMNEKSLSKFIGVFFVFLAAVMLILKVIFPLVGIVF